MERANIIMCAALSSDGLLLHRPLIGPYNTDRLISFLDVLHNPLGPAEERGGRNSPTFIAVWYNVELHHSTAVTDWFAAHPSMSFHTIPASILPTEEFFSALRWKVHDHHPHDMNRLTSLLDAMNAGCGDTSPDDCQGWI